jgi:hypothetical protein
MGLIKYTKKGRTQPPRELSVLREWSVKRVGVFTTGETM